MLSIGIQLSIQDFALAFKRSFFFLHVFFISKLKKGVFISLPGTKHCK